MIKKGFQTGLVAALMATANWAQAAGPELEGVHVSATSGGTQVTLDLSGVTNERLFTLDHPDRAVIDLSNTHPVGGLRLPWGAGVVSGFRVGTQPGGTLRVVMQLSSVTPARTAWFQTPGAAMPQLVITLGNASAAPLTASVSLPATTAAAVVTPTSAALTSAADTTDLSPKIVRAAHAPTGAGRYIGVAVDAGPGGQDPGAIGHGGTREKDVTLAIARALAEKINGEPGMRAALTRDRDEFLELRDRIHRARLARADMFVSVHADSIADRSITGASVYVLSVHGASNEAARWLAERENAADLMGGVRLDDKGSLAPVLLDATQSEIIGVSASAAERVLGALENVGEVRKAQVQHAGFVVLKSPDIPSMLVETAYISNPEEERRLRSAGQQARLADAIASGVRIFSLQNPLDGPRFKQQRRETLASAAGTAAAGTASP